MRWIVSVLAGGPVPDDVDEYSAWLIAGGLLLTATALVVLLVVLVSHGKLAARASVVESATEPTDDVVVEPIGEDRAT